MYSCTTQVHYGYQFSGEKLALLGCLRTDNTPVALGIRSGCFEVITSIDTDPRLRKA